MAFSAAVADAFTVPGREEIFLNLLHVEGVPCAGEQVWVGSRIGEIMEVEPRGVKDRSCLTGKPAPRHLMLVARFESGGVDGLVGNEIRTVGDDQ